VKGIKVDFMQSDKQGVIQLYLDIIRDAVDHQLLVNFHGSTLPRGWQRTWPNLMTMEAVKGGEQLWSQAFADQQPVHNTVLPFTRNVVGSMDYTPFTFQGVSEDIHTKTTRAHELATTVLFESALQHVSETVSHFESLPYYVWRFLKNLQTTWEETVYLSGRPGESVVLARRSGEIWYVAGIHADQYERTLPVNLDFLEARDYSLELIHDGATATEFKVTERVVNPDSNLHVRLAPNGGFVGTFIPYGK